MRKFSAFCFASLFAVLLLAPAAGNDSRAAEAATSPAKQSEKKKPSKAKKRGGRPSIVGVDPVRIEPLSQTVPILGRFVSVQSGEVSAEIDGAVRKLKVTIGDHVEAGDLIAVLDSEAIRAQVEVQQFQIDEGRADLGALKAELSLAEQDLTRQVDLKKSGAFSRAKHDDAIQNVARAKARILKAMAVIETRKSMKRLTEINLKKSTIRAPYASVVSEKSTEVGAYVRAGDAIVTLVSDVNLEIEADIPSARITGLVPGETVRWYLTDGRTFLARVRALLPTENPMTRTRPVRFTPQFDTPVAGLADSQTVTVNIPLGARKDILTVHKDAIVKRGGKSLVYVVANEVAEARRVNLGESAGPRIEVTSGLNEGDLVIIRGNERLRPGAQVNIR